MRIALLSALEPIAGADISPRGFARVGGRTLLQKQLEFALSFGCERIACLSHDLPSELIALQHEAERAGAQFQCVRSIRPLSGIVSASDELLVIGDGLAFDEVAAHEALSAGRVVVKFLADAGVAAGFERIDGEHSWAGLMLISGLLVERLAELPSDIDVQSSLLRLALQSGAKSVTLDQALITERDWMIISGSEVAQSYSEKWLQGNATRSSLLAPVHGLADMSAMAVLKRHSYPAKASRTARGISLALLIITGVCGYLSQPIAGYIALILGVFAFRFGETIAGVSNGPTLPSRLVRSWRLAQPLLVDVSLIGLAAIGATSFKLTSVLFAGVTLVGLMRMVELVAGSKPWTWLEEATTDRGSVAMICLFAAVVGNLVAGIQLIALILLGTILLRSHRSKLT